MTVARVRVVTVPGSTGAVGPDGGKPSWLKRRRRRIAAEIERNRRGGHRVPTWVLAVILAAVLGGWITLILAHR